MAAKPWTKITKRSLEDPRDVEIYGVRFYFVTE